MKYHSVFVALGSIGCALLLLGSRASSLAASQDDIQKVRHSEEGKKRKAAKDQTTEQVSRDNAKIAKRNEDLTGKQHDSGRQSDNHSSNAAKNHEETRVSRPNDEGISKHHDNVGHKDNFREHGKHDHYSSHGERDALIGAGVAVGIGALQELSKPKETIYNGVPVSEKPVATAKSDKHSQKSGKDSNSTRDLWSTIDPLRKDLPQDGSQ